MIGRQKRLNEVYDYLRGNYNIHTKIDFANAIKFGRTSLSSALNGSEKYLTDSLFEKICESFPGVFNLDYLLNGNGELTVENEVFVEQIKQKDVAMTEEQSSQTSQIIALYKKMYDDKCAELNRVLQDKERLEKRIEDMEDTITFLKNMWEQQESRELLAKHPFPVGVSETDKKYKPTKL